MPMPEQMHPTPSPVFALHNATTVTHPGAERGVHSIAYTECAGL